MSEPESLRIDKWLWFARMARTRSLAARLCEAGLVTVGGVVATKPNRAVRIGESITVVQGRMRRSLVVASLGERRGPPAKARRLYEEAQPPVPAQISQARWTPLLDEESLA
jgi:ribosome-associated heat shock protein Hsp15